MCCGKIREVNVSKGLGKNALENEISSVPVSEDEIEGVQVVPGTVI